MKYCGLIMWTYGLLANMERFMTNFPIGNLPRSKAIELYLMYLYFLLHK